jgi:hypothetical protein
MTKLSLAKMRRTAFVGGLATAAFLGWAAPAAAQGSAAIVSTGGQALYVRSAPSQSAKVLGVTKDDGRVRLLCQVKGSKVKGTRRTTVMWNKLSTGGYVSDAFVKRAKPPAPCKRPTRVKVSTTGLAGRMPSSAVMHPLDITAKQTTFTPSAEQLRNARRIVATAQKMNLPPRAWVIGIATSIQESTLHNHGYLGKRNDHDSQGLFQQRPSMGWGTVAQVTNPEHAAGRFFSKLVKLKNWNQLPVTKAAQRVQISGFPNAYAKHETQAGLIIAALYGKGPYVR